MTILTRILLASAAAVAMVQPLTAHAQDSYRLPPKAVVDILDTAPPPEASASPDGQWLVLTALKGMPTIEDRAAPMARLGGVRVNVATNGPYDLDPYDLHSSYTGQGTGYTLVNLDSQAKRTLQVPNAKLGPPMWSPDSRNFAFLRTVPTGVELWVVDVTTGAARSLSKPVINTARSIDYQSDAPCHWMDAARLLCHFIPEGRGPAPTPGVPTGPSIQETDGSKAPVWTFTNTLTNKFDETLFDYYMTSQPMIVDIGTGGTTPLGKPAIYQELTPSPDGSHLLSVRIATPYSYLVPANRFPKEVDILSTSGAVVQHVASVTMNSGGPESLGWAGAGPRGFAWRPSSTPALLYVEPLDKGEPKQAAEYRDRVMLLGAPFNGTAKEVLRTTDRIVSTGPGYQSRELFAFTQDASRMLVKQFAWGTRETKMWLVDANGADGAKPALLWSHNDDNWYGDPGTPITRSADGGTVLRQDGDWIYLAGEGGSPDGDHPFLSRFNLATKATERLFTTKGANYEQVVDVLDDKASRIVTRYETSLTPANYYLHQLGRGARKTALTDIKRPAIALGYSSKELVNYTRADGVPLSGTLYLPPNYKKGDRLPTIIWAYPREFADVKGAGQVRGTSYAYSGTSPRTPTDYMLFLTQGYAVLADASMPIVGGLQANDTYVEQLVGNAQAAIDMLVAKGVSDPKRMGVAGLSYGAFMTANLLANSDLFAAGYGLNGAYNRTLTPFGFQRERRTYWEAPEVYTRMSPFMQATKINEPYLIFHGEIDSNTGTFPIQSQRLFHAMKGLGGTAKLEMLPFEDHIYAARETRLHVLAEAFDWFDKYVKKAE
ncbi:prolyl oligopeptidase [Nostoc sp. 3335mG]|nr:prolyl oligopeptidase [Nostoc sp. 3335mG]